MDHPWELGLLDGFPYLNADWVKQDAKQITSAAHWPAIRRARAKCEFVMTSALYYTRPSTMNPPAQHDIPPWCWLAFVNRLGLHYTPGWTQVLAPLFEDDLPRSSHLTKIILPLIFVQPVIYMDFKLTVMRCFNARPLARKTITSTAGLVLVHHRHGARSVDVELSETRYAMHHRNFSLQQRLKIIDQLDQQRKRMIEDGFIVNQTRLVPDCYFLIWTSHNRSIQRILARRWYYEVAHYSMREQTSFNWVAAMVPLLQKTFLDRSYMQKAVRPCSCEISTRRLGAGGACFARGGERLVSRLGVGDTSGWQFDVPAGCLGLPDLDMANLSAEECCARARYAAPATKLQELRLESCASERQSCRKRISPDYLLPVGDDNKKTSVPGC